MISVSANELSNEEVEEARRLYTKVIEEFGKQARLGFIEAIPMTKQIEQKKMERAGKSEFYKFLVYRETCNWSAPSGACSQSCISVPEKISKRC